MNNTTIRLSLRLSAALLLVGQLLYIIITQFHADGPANNHPVVFAEYARSGNWTVDHIGQFFGMAVLVAGLIALLYSLDVQDELARWAGRFGAGLALVALALYGALQAVDGVANKQADMAWLHASAADRAARFASAEVVRWIEWGMRSYHNFALGLAVLLLAAAVLRTAWVPSPIAYLMGLSGITYLVQGWVVGAEGFSHTMSTAIVVAWVLDVVWMIWLAIVAWRMPESEPRRLADEGGIRAEAIPTPSR